MRVTYIGPLPPNQDELQTKQIRRVLSVPHPPNPEIEPAPLDVALEAVAIVATSMWS